MTATEPPRRPRLDEMTDDMLDALYDRLEAAETPCQDCHAPGGVGECGQHDEPISVSRRYQYAKAIHRYDNHHGLSVNDVPSAHHLGEADAVLAVRDDEMQQLRARVVTLEHVAAGNKRHVQAILPDLWAAEAALDRVRAATDTPPPPGSPTTGAWPGGWDAAMETVRIALDGPAGPTPAAGTVRRAVEYLLQTQQPDGTWEMSSGPNQDRTVAEQRLQRHRERMPDFVHRLVERITTVTVRQLAEQQPAVHIGGRGNAEDCPACRPEIDKTVLYPWICPGQPDPQS
ncbi:hypothetical protein [Streptomyces sp. DH12]|uniref:hypothetical protein n=1 Tax=Streptomyces sp. DH12 TaxID=2857010 RepID=UPI001E4E28C0|nr:hypothetical protein [Streptomyces sp. DH12]